MTKKNQTPADSDSVSVSDSDSVSESVSSEFQFDLSIMGEEFNAPRIPRLPYGLVINDSPAGLFIPEKNAVKAGWIGLDAASLPEIELASGEKCKGEFLGSVRMVILGCMTPYIRYKTSDALGDMRGVFVGLYEDDRHKIDKKTMEVCSEYLILFLSPNNTLLHTRPIRIRFKNVALWSLLESLEDFYMTMEMTFAQLAKTKASSKNDRWRALCVFEAQFKGIKEGEGSNRSYCCKVDKFTLPTPENFQTLFLGAIGQYAKIWEAYDMNVGALQLSLPPSAKSKQFLLNASENDGN
ncbi:MULTISPECIES: DUF5895 domain-containing protein [unclassified Microcoleus]|uniref:DUF5895 domain-containing protein n=1 Tax=unclassified Microcoleus TaxID=2642155 RepID=UPI002FD3D0EA